jgi:hypothetical protein
MGLLHEQLQTDPSRTQGIHETFAFVVSGDEGGMWWIEAADGAGAVHEGPFGDATLTVRISDAVLIRLFGNREWLRADACFTELSIDGDTGKAVLLTQIFGAPLIS